MKFNVKEQILRAAWNKPIYIKEAGFFAHDYAENVQLTRKEYGPDKNVLKENKIRFQTPLTKMCVDFDSGTVVYSSAEEAPADLRRCGFKLESVPTKKSKDITVDTINNLLPWNTAGVGGAGSSSGLRESAREKLKVFQRSDTESTTMDE